MGVKINGRAWLTLKGATGEVTGFIGFERMRQNRKLKIRNVEQIVK